MSLFADRVFETTTTSGTGTITLAGAVLGRQAFSDAFNVGQEVIYLISQDGTGWEVGYGTLSSVSPDLLTRDNVLSSSNAGLKVNFAAGGSVKNVLNPPPADLFRGVILDPAGPTVRFDFDKAPDLATAATTDIGGIVGNSVDLTGGATITGLGTITAGVQRITRTLGTPTFTHSVPSLILPAGGADIVAEVGDVQHWLSLGAGNWVCTAYHRASGLAVVAAVVPRNYIDGGIVSNNGTDATNDLDFTAVEAADEGNAATLKTAAGTRAVDAVFAEGGPGFRDSGDNLTGAKTFHLYAIGGDGKTDDWFASTSVTPTLPAGFTYKRRVMSLPWTGSAWRVIRQRGDKVLLDVSLNDDDSANPGVLARIITLSVPTGIIVDALVTFEIEADLSFNNTCGLMTPLALTDTTPSATGAKHLMTETGPNSGIFPEQSYLEVETNTSGQIRCKVNISGANTQNRVITHGWIDRRGKDA